MTAALSEVCIMDQSKLQAMENVVKKAINLWLEFETQRCRLVIAMPGSSLTSKSERVKKALAGDLVLTLVPELRRYGDSNGQDLHLKQRVGGCEAETVRISPEEME